MQIELRPYDHPHVQALVERLQAEYVQIYGEPDLAPADPDQFSPPHGAFALGYADGVPVAMGGWRLRDDGRAELKRMYVVDEHRGRGLSREILAWLEASVVRAGMAEMILESNQKHPAALGLYRSHGYATIPSFGYYSDSPENVCLGRSLARSASSSATIAVSSSLDGSAARASAGRPEKSATAMGAAVEARE